MIEKLSQLSDFRPIRHQYQHATGLSRSKHRLSPLKPIFSGLPTNHDSVLGSSGMMFLHHTSHVPAIYRKLLVVLTAVVTLTSIKIQTASALEILPSTPSFSTATQMAYDALQDSGFKIPARTNENISENASDITVSPINKTVTESTETAPVKYTKRFTVTAYNSVPWQTDASPCISADGSNICKLKERGEQSCAAALPFGTKVNVPGFGVCTVRDRLAPKFSYRIDLYFGGADQIKAAKQWGKRHVEVAVLATK